MAQFSPSTSTPIIIAYLADKLFDRYGMSGKTEDLENCILLYRDARTLCPRPCRHPQLRATLLNNLANSLCARHGVFGKMEDLEEGILLRREALTLGSDRAMYLSNLANSLQTRYSVLGEMENLNESILLIHEALNLRPLGHPNRAISLNTLANAIYTRYSALGKIQDLDESVLLHREALSLRSVGHHERDVCLNNLGNGLYTRYSVFGEIKDLQDSVLLYREGLGLRPVGHPHRASSLHNVANSLYTQYGVLGKMDDLENCILLYREALGLRQVGNPNRHRTLNSLANALYTRYNVLGKGEDLENCIILYRQALDIHPHGHPDRSMSLNNLANGLSSQGNALHKLEDLDDSIRLFREALNLCPLGHPHHAALLNNLAKNLSSRYEILGERCSEIEDLEESIRLYREAMSLYPPGHPHGAMSLNDLANRLSARFDVLGEMKDLEDSILLCREALSLWISHRPDRCIPLSSLAKLLLKRYAKFCREEDLQEAFLLYEEAACEDTSFIQNRLKVALQWASEGQDFQHTSTFTAYSTSLELLDRFMATHSSVESQQRFLATAETLPSLASDAAFAAIKAGKIVQAVEFLEQGRAMLWSRIDGYKYRLEELRRVEGGEDLADHFEALGAKLEHLALSSTNTRALDPDISGEVVADARIKQHRVLLDEWEDLVARIRKLDGFHYFLRPLPFETLRLAASDGPVILVNINRQGSDAIILLKDRPPELVNLPELQVDELREQKLGTAREIKNTLRYLWDSVVQPIVTRLTELHIPRKSRIWWCPTGALCSLPLHAACRGKNNLQDLYTSSYISTVSSLLKARAHIRVAQESKHIFPKLLVVGQPSTRQKLERVKDEVEEIRNLSPDDSVDVLFGPQAHSQAVIDALEDHSWIHFACHGHLGDNDNPFQASFELHDRRLPLLDLLRARLPNAELAFLSACHSAEGDSDTPDESIHLSAALQFCGFRSVIGTLWEMDDEDGPVISKLFYQYMFRNRDAEKIDFRDSAYALNFAIKKMKEAGVPLDRLVLFVHTGV